MTAAAARMDAFDVKRALASSDEGERLAAIAYLYAHSDPAMLDLLASALSETEDKGFNQYWGIRTIQKMIQQGGRVSGESLKKLRRLAKDIPPGTDRSEELSKILHDLDD